MLTLAPNFDLENLLIQKCTIAEIVGRGPERGGQCAALPSAATLLEARSGTSEDCRRSLYVPSAKRRWTQPHFPGLRLLRSSRLQAKELA